MGSVLSTFAGILLLTLLPPLLLGIAVWLCQRLFCVLVGEKSGRPLLLAASVLSTPLREAAHALGCVLSFHRVEEVCFFCADDPDGEFGFVEHSYNPRNPVALFGNLVYAVAPVALGLFAVMVIFLSCFRGVIGPFLDQIALLGEAGAGFGAYAHTTLSLIPAIFSEGSAGVFSKIVGCLLLLLIALGIHVAPRDILDAFSGLLIYTGLSAVAAFVLALFDDRIIALAMARLRGFAATVTALFAVVLLAAACLLVIAGVCFVIRTLLDLDREGAEEDK